VKAVSSSTIPLKSHFLQNSMPPLPRNTIRRFPSRSAVTPSQRCLPRHRRSSPTRLSSSTNNLHHLLEALKWNWMKTCLTMNGEERKVVGRETERDEGAGREVERGIESGIGTERGTGRETERGTGRETGREIENGRETERGIGRETGRGNGRGTTPHLRPLDTLVTTNATTPPPPPLVSPVWWCRHLDPSAATPLCHSSPYHR